MRVLARCGLCLALVIGAGCGQTEDPKPEPSGSLQVGQTRQIELRSLRFDVSNFEQVMTKQDILELPAEVRDRMWLLDLDLTNGPTTPRLLDNALEAVKNIDPATLSQAARNMQRLLKMTPDTADVRGTNLENLVELSPLIGIAPERVLADLLGIDAEDTVLAPEVIAQSILELVIETHPNARTRLGPKTAENPEGIYPVTPGKMPVTLADAVTNFSSLSERFGPIFKDGVYHPGFVASGTQARVLTDDFKLIVRANANALPYKGVDLSDVSEASVNSTRSQISTIFDFNDPNWLVVEGLVPGAPVIESLTFRIVEADAFIPGGTEPFPTGIGKSPAWKLPAWSLERMLVGAAQRAFAGHSAEVKYYTPTREEPLFTGTVTNGWQEIKVTGNVGQPPAPCYLWDMLVEVAQVRLHDGGLKEGEASVEFTLHDIPAGTDTAVIEQTIEENLEADPNMLRDVANEITDTTRGNADFYYYRADPNNDLERKGDWLFFIVDGDIALDSAGKPVRPYAYQNPGFFADPELTQRVSTQEALDGDTEHHKARIKPGDVLYIEDDTLAVFQIKVGEKPSVARLQLSITRIR